jgi:hypothetical protein
LLILRCTDTLPGVGLGYTCMVGVRSLRHMTSPGMVDAMTAVGVPSKQLNSVGFYNVLSSLSIPASAVTGGADYAAR